MSALSDYYVTHDESDLAAFRQECEADERAYWDSLEDYEGYEDEEDY